MADSQSTDPAITSAAKFFFGPFCLLSDRRLLLDGDTPVRLGGRAYEILFALVERPGIVVTKEELFARAWPNQFVEEGNLKFHIGVLRKALRDGQEGARFISNVPGRGYCFVAPIEKEAASTLPPTAREGGAALRHLPAPLRRIVGRAETIVALTTRLTEDRFTTIVGPGGIGKTTVAVAVADALGPTFRDGVGFVDLAPLAEGALVPSAIAAAFEFAIANENAVQGLVSLLGHKELLIVLDNCEHLIEPVAALAEEIFKSAGEVHILATSREPLRAEGEHVHRLAPLAAPSASPNLTATEALAFPAVQLFVERAAASQDTFELSDADAPVVAELCRRLDGIALAIEIAAGRVDTFAIAELASGLDDRLRLLIQGRRTSLGRHQTLRAALDWSYELLSEQERSALRGLAIFAGAFTLQSASEVLTSEGGDSSQIFESLANLIAKSLINRTVENGVSFHRLLDTTRAYALLKLEESGEKDAMAERHARHYLSALARAEIEWHHRPVDEWLATHRRAIDNVRAALDWAFSPGADVAIGIALTEAALPLWFQLSLIGECCGRVERALSALSVYPDSRRQLQLRASLAWSLMQTRGTDAASAAWAEVLRLAEEAPDVDYQLRSLWGLWAAQINSARLKDAREIAERFCLLAEKSEDRNDVFVGDRMVGYVLHLMGEQSAARAHIERMLARYVTPSTGPRLLRFVFDQRATARSILARILWLQGFPDRASAAARAAIDEANADNDMLSVCQVLVQAACPISILTGEYQQLEAFVDVLLDYSTKNALGFWRTWGRCFRAVQITKSGSIEEGLVELRGGMEELRNIQYGVYYVVFLSEYAAALGRVGQLGEGLAAIDEAINRSHRNSENWYLPELLRVKGELILLAGGPHALTEAEKTFRESLDLAQRQEALSWQLRAATSLARLPLAQSQKIEALELLRATYRRFEEGHTSADLVEAQRLLREGD